MKAALGRVSLRGRSATPRLASASRCRCSSSLWPCRWGVTCDARPTRVNWPCVFMSLNRRSSSNQQIGQITSSCNRKDSNDGKEKRDDDATYGGARSASSTTDGQAGDCSTDGAWSNG